MPHGFKVADMHATVDGMYIDEVVTKLVDINCRPCKSWEVLQRRYRGLRLEEGQTEVKSWKQVRKDGDEESDDDGDDDEQVKSWKQVRKDGDEESDDDGDDDSDDDEQGGAAVRSTGVGALQTTVEGKTVLGSAGPIHNISGRCCKEIINANRNNFLSLENRAGATEKRIDGVENTLKKIGEQSHKIFKAASTSMEALISKLENDHGDKASADIIKVKKHTTKDKEIGLGGRKWASTRKMQSHSKAIEEIKWATDNMEQLELEAAEML
ncbi:ATP-dependent RNA helicase dbp4-like [Cryptomeria japonica]|uniref:ATP-dependent RNA helicase dbp4-like n=1 Tax=Cryptomeria japonica TaxID=3369 RepID=UPI0027D9D792|nr:ATP-dependent RNA helicase dbp4-like [Cryptomeria japonica]